MDHYIVSARKYRPSTFQSVVGQKALTETLKNAIATQRLAHAYLFCGSRGVGKTSCARIFAKTINCQHPTPDGEACNECESCRQFNDSRSMNIIELDAASHNGIDDIKSLIDQVMVPPSLGRYRVFIIDEVHMLSQAAFNAFLKTLEEPPEHAIFILATTEKHKIIPTILSRCQIYDFARITTADMVSHMQYVASQEGIEAEAPALGVIARQADGAMRDALSIFDQVAASSRGHITYQSTIESLNVLDDSYFYRLMQAFLQGDVTEALLIYKEVRDKGFDSLFFLQGLAQYMRDLMVAADPRTVALLDAAPEVVEKMVKTAAACPVRFYYQAMAVVNDADTAYRTASNKQFLIELTLIRLCQLFGPSSNDAPADGGHQPLRAIEAKAEGPIHNSQFTIHNEAAPMTEKAAAESAPTPAPVPAPQTPPAAVKKAAATGQRRVSLKTPGFHSSTTATATTATTASTATTATTPASPTTDAAPLTPQAAIKAFVEAHPGEQLLAGSLSAAGVALADHALTLTAVSGPQSDILAQWLPALQSHLRQALDDPSLTVTIAETDTSADPATWTQQQVLDHILAENPQARDFVHSLQLVIE